MNFKLERSLRESRHCDNLDERGKIAKIRHIRLISLIEEK